MLLEEIKTPADEESFLAVPRLLHADDPQRVELPDAMVRAVFDPQINGYFDSGEAIRWILREVNGAPLGRVAAFYRRRDGDTDCLGGLGFFECVDDQDAADALFAAAEGWLAARGLVGVDGPINFGERDRMWGLLVSGFEAPVFLDPYNPPYVEGLFAAAGYRPVMESLSYQVVPSPADLESLSENYEARSDGTHRFANLAELGAARFAESMHHVYQAALSATGRSRHWTAAELQGWIEADTTLDPRWLWLAYVGDEPAAVLGYQPDLNQLASQARVDRLKGFVCAVHPAHQSMGLLAGVGVQLHRAMFEAGMREVLMTGIGGHSPRIRAVVEAFGGQITRVHATFRKHFDRSRPVAPLPMPVWGDRWSAPAPLETIA